MQRHMQNISFLVIAAVLLGCAFFFSQQTKLEEQKSKTEGDAIMVPAALENFPACSVELEGDEPLACLEESVETSERLIESMVEQILEKEMDTERRESFKKVESAWEDSRAKECAYVGEMAADDVQAQIDKTVCLCDQNLERFEQLQAYWCEWYSGDGCSDTLSANE